MDEYYQAVRFLPSWLAHSLLELPAEQAGRVHEIRMRVGCPLLFTVDGEVQTLQELTGKYKKLTQKLNALQLEEIFDTLCGGSVHSHQNEIAAGYIALPGGCRVGIGGAIP